MSELTSPTAADIRRAEELGRKLAEERSLQFTPTYNRRQKKCNTCGRMKVLAQYPPRSSNADGRSSKCKDCTRLYNQKRTR